MKPTTITDVARAAGVSPSTVSRALQDHPRISLRRRETIKGLAVAMGYHPNEVARSLVTGRTHTLGVVVTDVTDPFVAEVMHGAEAAGRESGYILLFAMSNHDPQQEIAAIRLLRDREVDGMIVISGRAGAEYAGLRTGTEDDWPLVLVNNDLSGPATYSVRMANRRGAALVVSYLQGLGHHHIALISGPEQGRSTRERLDGYRTAMAAGSAEGISLVTFGEGQPEDGIRGLHTLLDTQPRCTAITCYNDLTALGVLAEAARLGVNVPEELSVIGYDDIPMSAYSIPPLTTIRQPKVEMGRAAVEICVTALDTGSAESRTLEGQLVVRGSAAPPHRR